VGEADEGPLASVLEQAAEGELLEAPRGADLPERRFDGCLSSGIDGSPRWRREQRAHGSAIVGVLVR